MLGHVWPVILNFLFIEKNPNVFNISISVDSTRRKMLIVLSIFLIWSLLALNPRTIVMIFSI